MIERPPSGGQSHALSYVEAITNVAVGFVIAVLTQMILFPAVGIRLPFNRHLLIGTAFTLVSLVRSYLLRRLFERLGRRWTGRPCTGDGLSNVCHATTWRLWPV